ncbi:unnamed protein product [Cylicocyclus nassatus]|uniref:Uncharacterized protein n=1 Tax=Cylicocyclus nassatus TaxID=53992 RepID=A0AA36GEQ5_CYLNA|nr:unnamed protein product [Cylicocyclus nassatus]
MLVHLCAVFLLVAVSPILTKEWNCRKPNENSWEGIALKKLQKILNIDNLTYCDDNEPLAKRCAQNSIDYEFEFETSYCIPYVYKPVNPERNHDKKKVTNKDIAVMVALEYAKTCYRPKPTHVACARRSTTKNKRLVQVFSCIFKDQYHSIEFMTRCSPYDPHCYCPPENERLKKSKESAGQVAGLVES